MVKVAAFTRQAQKFMIARERGNERIISQFLLFKKLKIFKKNLCNTHWTILIISLKCLGITIKSFTDSLQYVNSQQFSISLDNN